MGRAGKAGDAIKGVYQGRAAMQESIKGVESSGSFWRRYATWSSASAYRASFIRACHSSHVEHCTAEQRCRATPTTATTICTTTCCQRSMQHLCNIAELAELLALQAVRSLRVAERGVIRLEMVGGEHWLRRGFVSAILRVINSESTLRMCPAKTWLWV